MRARTLLLVVALMAFAGSAGAQEPAPIETLPSGEDIIVPLRLEEPAPFQGQLFSNDTALRWANWLVQYKLRLQLDVQEQKSLCEVRTNALKKKHLIDQEKYNTVVLDYKVKLSDAEYRANYPPWYKDFWVGTTLGAITVSAIGLVIVGVAAN